MERATLVLTFQSLFETYDMRKVLAGAILSLVCSLAGAQMKHPSTYLPAGGNAWITGKGKVAQEGVTGLMETSVVTFYIRVNAGDLLVSLLYQTEKPGKAIVTLQTDARTVSISPSVEEHPAGTWPIGAAGYVAITVTGLTGGALSGLELTGSSVDPTSSFVRDNEGNFFYWGRRGPSVHLRYDLKGHEDIEFFYSEITVPEKNDVIGSYYMANGFSDGYFGFQVNSEKERRVLFSVWSPFKTDDPKSIPEEDKIILMKKGQDVYTGEFGNEGSGGQSYLRYPWKAGTTYGFLLRAQPEGANTIYTSWFFAPEQGKWKLIASWRRPKKATYLAALYSFLENFMPETGNVERKALYGNQWVRDKAGNWTELTQVKFTGDNTARKNYRKDYGGGVTNETFYLRNCGFFSDFTSLDQSFTRSSKGRPPVIDISSLD